METRAAEGGDAQSHDLEMTLLAQEEKALARELGKRTRPENSDGRAEWGSDPQTSSNYVISSNENFGNSARDGESKFGGSKDRPDVAAESFSTDLATGESILVHLNVSDGQASLCTVYIDRKQAKPLPNYGGYRDTRNGVHYLNAVAQTEWEKKKKKKKEPMVTRENLKPEQRPVKQQTNRETWTQMDKPGVILENRGDYVMIPGPYFTSDDWDEVRVEAAIIIQKYVRRAIARRTAHRIRAYAKERKEFWEEQERIRKQEADEHLKHEIQRRMNPHSGDDFEILYTELATWCAQELSKIDQSGVTGMERRKAIKELLLKLYNALAKPVGTNDERMGVLGYVKWTVQVFDTALTREILELIEREADLMMRGRPAKSLSGLRLRILNLFLQFVETPEFNPEAAAQQYVPVDFDYGVNSTPTRKPGQ